MTQGKESSNVGDATSEFDKWIIKDLAKSGLTPENFTVEPLRSGAEPKERLGFTAVKDELGNWVKIIDIGGYWIPYPNVPGYYRLKLQREIIDQEGNNIKYLSPKKEMGFGNHAYILPQVAQVAQPYNPDKPIYITEGEKKAAKATLEGFSTIGLSGVWNFKDSENDFLAELAELNLRNRKCYICFDSDISHKFQVRHAELRLAVAIINRGGILLSVRLPNGSNQ